MGSREPLLRTGPQCTSVVLARGHHNRWGSRRRQDPVRLGALVACAGPRSGRWGRSPPRARRRRARTSGARAAPHRRHRPAIHALRLQLRRWGRGLLHQLHVLRQAPHGRAALAVERDGEELAVAAGRDQGAEGLALEEADAGELGGRDARGAGEELAGRHGGRCAWALARRARGLAEVVGLVRRGGLASGTCVGRKAEGR